MYIKTAPTKERVTGNWLQVRWAGRPSGPFAVDGFARRSRLVGHVVTGGQRADFRILTSKGALEISPIENGAGFKIEGFQRDFDFRSPALDGKSTIVRQPMVSARTWAGNLSPTFKPFRKTPLVIAPSWGVESHHLSFTDAHTGRFLELSTSSPTMGLAVDYQARIGPIQCWLTLSITRTEGAGRALLDGVRDVGETHHKATSRSLTLDLSSSKGATTWGLGASFRALRSEFSTIIYRSQDIGVETNVNGRLDAKVETNSTSREYWLTWERRHNRNGRLMLGYRWLEAPTGIDSEYAIRAVLFGVGERNSIDGSSWRSHALTISYSHRDRQGRTWDWTLEQYIPLGRKSSSGQTNGPGARAYGGLSLMAGVKF